MKSRYKYIVSAAMLLVVTTILAVTVRFYDSKQLSSTLVTSIVQDSRGYIWIGTEFGLNKFDGVRYTRYFNKENDTTSLVNNSISELFVSRSGKLWVLSKGGAQVFHPDGDFFEKVYFAGNVHHPFLKDIQEAKDGTIYLLSSENGLFCVAPGSMVAQPMRKCQALLGDTKAYSLLLDAKSRLWVRTEKGILLLDKMGKGQLIEKNSAGYPDKFVDILEDANGGIYAFTHNKALRYEESTKHFKTWFEYSVGLASIRIYKNAENDFIMTADRKGVFRVDIVNKTLVPISLKEGENEDWTQKRISAYCQDVGRQTWLGIFQKGVMCFRNEEDPFHYMSLPNDEVVSCLYSDSNGQLYVGKGYDGIQKVGQETFMGQNLLAGKRVVTVCELSQDSWLVGTYDGGDYFLNPHTGANKKIESSDYSRVKSIVEDRQGNLYMAMFMKGVKKFDASGEHELPLCKGQFKMANDFVNVLFADCKNRIWIGYYYGFEIYDANKDRQINLPVDSVLRSSTVYGIDESNDGTVWLGTNRGLFAYSDKTQSWTRYTEDNGLPNNNVCAVIDTKDGNLWVSTYRGLGRLDRKTGSWQHYFYGNGLQYTNYGRGVGCLTKYGLVCFGNDNGFTYFMPKKVVNKSFSRGITLTGVLLKDKQLSSRDKSGGKRVMDSAIEDANELTFSYDDNTFTLQFSTMDYRDLENVAYQYRFSDEKKGRWNSTQKGISSIMFTHLSWGTHHLQVRAVDDGAVSGVRDITIHILPPWYASWWAYSLYLLIVVAIGYLVWRSYHNKRIAMDNEMKIRLYVDISHEFRSPLTLIRCRDHAWTS